MKTKRKPMILLLGVLLLSVTMACQALVPNRDDSSVRPQPKPETTQASGTGSGSSIITVTEDDFSLSLEPARPSAGEVTFVVNNEGRLPHDFKIQGNGVDHQTSRIEPGGSETFSLNLEPGTYDYECTVEGHAMLGMQGSFTIEASSSN